MDGGHAGTGLSIAEGLATARDIRHSLERVAGVVHGDAGPRQVSASRHPTTWAGRRPLLLGIDDNEMSIEPIGRRALAVPVPRSSRLAAEARAADRGDGEVPGWSGRFCTRVLVERALPPGVRPELRPPAGQLFEDLGITYIGVMPGHDRRLLEETFRRALGHGRVTHVRKGKGCTAPREGPGLVPTAPPTRR